MGVVGSMRMWVPGAVSYRRLDGPGIADLIGAGAFYGSGAVGGVGGQVPGCVHRWRWEARSVTLLVRVDNLAKSMS